MIHYLFILVADVMSRRMDQRIRDKEIEGIRPARTFPEIHHLLFADDSLFFIKGSVRNAQAPKATLDEYCKASGQRVKFNMSSLFCGINQGNVFTNEVASVFRMNVVRDPGKYLGLPSIWGRSKCEALSLLSSKIVKKLEGWRTKFLNNTGKEVLIKALISAIPTYSMSVFKLVGRSKRG